MFKGALLVHKNIFWNIKHKNCVDLKTVPLLYTYDTLESPSYIIVILGNMVGHIYTAVLDVAPIYPNHNRHCRTVLMTKNLTHNETFFADFEKKFSIPL